MTPKNVFCLLQVLVLCCSPMTVLASISPIEIPLEFFRVKGVPFSDLDIAAMTARTTAKLRRARLRIKVLGITEIGPADLAKVDSQNIETLLSYGDPVNTIRVFLVSEDLDYQNDSWTYDPLLEPAGIHWKNAIFITDRFSKNDDQHYEDLGYLPSADTLLHELGHVLMQEATHVFGPKTNFFHEDSEFADDTLTREQIDALRHHPLCQKAPKE